MRNPPAGYKHSDPNHLNYGQSADPSLLAKRKRQGFADGGAATTLPVTAGPLAFASQQASSPRAADVLSSLPGAAGNPSIQATRDLVSNMNLDAAPAQTGGFRYPGGMNNVNNLVNYPYPGGAGNINNVLYNEQNPVNLQMLSGGQGDPGGLPSQFAGGNPGLGYGASSSPLVAAMAGRFAKGGPVTK